MKLSWWQWFVLALIALGVAFAIVLAIAFLGYFNEKRLIAVDGGSLFSGNNASEICIQKGLLAHPHRSGNAALANMKGGQNSGHKGIDVLPYFKDAATKYNVPLPLLLAMAEQEQTFASTAPDHNFEDGGPVVGLMQIKIGTFNGAFAAANSGAGSSLKNDPRDVKSNIYVASYLISTYYAKYNHSISLTAAAYNAGTGNIKNNQVPNFPETVSYVADVTVVYNEMVKCQQTDSSASQSSSTTTSSATGQQIVDKAKTLIGQDANAQIGATCSNSTNRGVTNNLLCASIAADIINPIAGTKLGADSDVNWRSSDGKRLYIDPAYKVGDSDTKISLADLQPGDYVFYANSAGIQHSAVYIGQYSGNAGFTSADKPTTGSDSVQTNSAQTVVGLRSSIQAVSAVDINYFGMRVIGVKRFTR